MMCRLLVLAEMFAWASPVAAQAYSSPATSTTVTQQPKYDYSTATPVGGSWSYKSTPAGSIATFAAKSGQTLLAMSCFRPGRRVSISRPASSPAAALFVWGNGQSRSLPANFDPTTSLLTASVGAMDPLLDALAFSRGRIVVGTSNGGTLVAPLWPEVIRLIEDCRV